jgi:RNA polymerase sigma-70 factor, ECF subfamily
MSDILGSCVNQPAAPRNREVMDDDGLIAQVAADGDGALRELFSRHAPWLAARLRVVLPAADVEDVLQETILGVWRGAPSYRPEGRAEAWLWGIARRQAAMFLRRRGPAELVLPAVVETDLGQVSEATEAVMSRMDLENAVGALGPPGAPDRETWQLLCVEDRSVAEVAVLMGVPEGTVKSRAHRARRMLRAALADRLAVEGDSL